MAQYKVAIDAGHGGSDPGAVFGNRREKDDVFRLANEVGKILEQNGVEVFYVRNDDEYETPFKKATDANNAGVDYFVSIHRNSSETQNQYDGVETLVFSDSGVKAQMARNINAELEKLGFKNLGVDERPNLVVLKRTKMPAVLVETGFINSDKDNQIFDDKFGAMAQGIADGILDTLYDNRSAKTTTLADDSMVEKAPEKVTQKADYRDYGNWNSDEKDAEDVNRDNSMNRDNRNNRDNNMNNGDMNNADNNMNNGDMNNADNNMDNGAMDNADNNMNNRSWNDRDDDRNNGNWNDRDNGNWNDRDNRNWNDRDNGNWNDRDNRNWNDRNWNDRDKDKDKKPAQRLYRVQVGAYRNKESADRMLNALLIEGFPAFIILDNGIYKVQVGAFRYLENAIKMEERLRRFRYNTYITI